MGLITLNGDDKIQLSPLAAEHLTPGGHFDVSDYVGLAASSPTVLEMVERLKTNQPAGVEEENGGAAFIFRQGIASAMERTELARHFTLALCGRAKNVAPILAERMPIESARMLLDVGGGTGIYSIAYLRQHPDLRAIVLDRPEVLKIAAEFATQYGVTDRIEFLAADMFADTLPAADVILLSNILHDWDVPECQSLVTNCATALTPQGKLVIHDVLLNDALDGPLPIALYSAALFTLTEGRAYSAAEFRDWLASAGLQPQPPIETAIHCHAIAGIKSS
jgi:ubiquinone/menaquinone biosynthesis C-methylase UbiE